NVATIGHQTPSLYTLPKTIHRRQPVLCREVYKLCAIEIQHRIAQYEQCAHATAHHLSEGAVELFGSASLQEQDLQPQRLRCALDATRHQLVTWIGWIREDSYTSDFRDRFLEELNLLRVNFPTKGAEAQSGRVLARVTKTLDETEANWIPDADHDNGDRLRGF